MDNMKSVISIVLLVPLVCLVQSGPVKDAASAPAADCLAKCNRQNGLPLCADNLKTYDSECHMKCDDPKLERYYHGPCLKFNTNECVCIDVFNPVCGSDGKKYSNSCQMRCAGVLEEGSCGETLL